MSSRALVWFKRDLRCADQAPLAAASGFDESAGLFLFEPSWLQSPECDAQHVAFARACLAPLAHDLAQCGLPLLIEHSEAVHALQALWERWPFTHLLSHEETGPLWSWERDKAVAAWCKARGVQWQEWPQNGVVRRLRSRQGWAGRWEQRMNAPQVAAPLRFEGAAELATQAKRDLQFVQAMPLEPHRPLPEAGERAAQACLESFLLVRGANYRKDLSSPVSAEQGCSRLSSHLAFGTLSMRQVHQQTLARMLQLRAQTGPSEQAQAARRMAYQLGGFASRLRWHCHFMQKLEDEPQMERRNLSRSFDGVRDEAQPDAARLAAWCEGRTGYPMVDACMRQLRATGWLNFRMRAMLVSFASYHLWLHWREPGLFLARQFLDFEPGIHWSQMQMQAGTTGINTFRMYSPSKQQADHDPTGEYIRRWLPEWGTAHYPPPIVNEREAIAHAKVKMYGLRGQAASKAEAQAIQHKHGSRKSGLPPSGARARTATAGSGKRAATTRTAGCAPAGSPQAELFE